MMTSEATSSRIPCSRTSTMKPATITVASKEWNQELKYLSNSHISMQIQIQVEIEREGG
jgi:hypothetical protein